MFDSPTNYLTQFPLNVYLTQNIILQWYFSQNTSIFIHKNKFKMTSAKSHPFSSTSMCWSDFTACSWTKKFEIWFKFYSCLLLRVQVTIANHWFMKCLGVAWTGDTLLSKLMLAWLTDVYVFMLVQKLTTVINASQHFVILVIGTAAADVISVILTATNCARMSNHIYLKPWVMTN